MFKTMAGIIKKSSPPNGIATNKAYTIISESVFKNAHSRPAQYDTFSSRLRYTYISAIIGNSIGIMAINWVIISITNDTPSPNGKP